MVHVYHILSCGRPERLLQNTVAWKVLVGAVLFKLPEHSNKTLEHDGTRYRYDGLALELTLKGQVKGQRVVWSCSGD